MSYILTGRLQGYVAPDCLEPLSSALVRFYRLPGAETTEALPSAKPDSTTSMLTDEEERAKEHLRLGEAHTNDQGEFRINLSERSASMPRSSTGTYLGEPIQIDVLCRTVPGMGAERQHEGVRFTLATVRPAWQPSDSDYCARWDYNVSQRFWHEARAALDAWVICGRVVSATSAVPMAGVRVQAFDGDIAQHDLLGSAVTDALGRFRIDYKSEDFRDTPIPWGNFEAGGPDLFFRVSRNDGTVLLDEGRSRGSKPDRENAANSFFAELYVRGNTAKI